MPLTKVQAGMVEATGTASSSTFLRGDGAWATPVSITSGTAVTASGTSVDFTGIPAGVKRITVMFSSVSTNGASPVQIQIGSGSFSTSSYSSSGSFTTASTVGATASSSGILVGGGVSSANQRVGLIILTLLSSNSWIAAGSGSFSDGVGTWAAGGLTPNLSGTLDRVRITTVNGTDTFDAGTINIMYET